jgi:hypothetical protein
MSGRWHVGRAPSRRISGNRAAFDTRRKRSRDRASAVASGPSIVRTGWCVLLVLLLLLPQAGCSERRRPPNEFRLAVHCDGVCFEVDPTRFPDDELDVMVAAIGLENGHFLRRQLTLCIDAHVPIPALGALLKARSVAVTARIDALWRVGPTVDQLQEARVELGAICQQLQPWWDGR